MTVIYAKEQFIDSFFFFFVSVFFISSRLKLHVNYVLKKFDFTLLDKSDPNKVE